MFQKDKFDSTSKFFEAVNSSTHQPQLDLPIKQKSNFAESIEDINTAIENLDNPEKAAQSISFFCKFPDLNELLNEKPEIIPVIISFLSPDTPDLIILSLKFIKKCCLLENFPEHLLNFVSLDFFSKMAFASGSKQATMYISEIMSQIILSIGEKSEEDILSFLEQTDKVDNGLLKSVSIKILYAYLQKSHSITPFFQNIDLINRLNANLLMLNYPNQLISSLNTIKYCIIELETPFQSFNIIQIIKLIRCDNFSIQELSIEIITNILLLTTSDDFPFKGQLCKSLNWAFNKGSIKLILKAFYCLRTFFDLCSDQYPQIIELLDDNFFKIIFGLLSSGDNGSIEAMHFLIYIAQDDLHPEYQRRVIEALLELEIRDQLESLSLSDNIIASHSLVLLNLIEKFA